MELLQKATSVAMLIFVLSSMLAMGLGLTVSQIITPLRHARLVVLSLLANFWWCRLPPFLAALLRLDQPLGVGLLLWVQPPARRSCRNWPRLPRVTWPSRWA